MKVKKIFGLLVMLALVIASCRLGTSSSSSIGTYEGQGLTLTLTKSTWTLSGPEGSQSGTYIKSGKTLTFSGDLSDTGTISGKTLIVTVDGLTFTLTKQ
jgi:hypothetical protein